ncbi:MAG: hypothetical protein J5I91_03860 [Bacteroidetes bacterium]|nr:hypothetical protein [Bacteroidota bacterium]
MNKRRIFIILFLIVLSIVIYASNIYIHRKLDRIIASGELIQKYYEKVIKDKIWVHRVNSIERLKETAPLYSGVEVDILYIPEKANFDVSHPPAGSTGVTLYNFIKSNPNKSTHYWLDLKNLDSTVSAGALSRLLSICKDLSINKDFFIIESDNPKELKVFSDSGFKTSYYLHYPGLYTLSEAELLTQLSIIKGNMKYYTTYISSPFHDYEILKQYFPEKEKLLWMAESKLKFRDELQKSLYALKVASDPKVKVILYWAEMKAEIL